jgi:anti-anti-sigma regulatory factor
MARRTGCVHPEPGALQRPAQPARRTMKTLQVDRAYTLLRLTDNKPSEVTLTDQVAPYIEQAKRLILDVDGIQFNSMLIGELVNLHRLFERHWGGASQRIALVNLTPSSRAVMERVRLHDIFVLADSVADVVKGHRALSKASAD